MFGLMSNIRRSTRSGRSYKPASYDSVSFRVAGDEDAAAIRRVAALDGKRVPMGEVLVAEVDSEIIAALSVSDGSRVADPFRWTSDVVVLMEMRAAQLQATGLGTSATAAASVRASLRTA
jgi:hypothetical protein